MTDPTPAPEPVAEVSAGDRAALDVALAWAADEGWRPGRHDAEAFAAEDPAGLLATRVGGRVVSTLTAVRYGDAFGFVGLFITDPAARGRGYGQAVWAAGMAHVDDLPCVGLDGVVARESLYAALGFRRAHLSQRWATAGGALGSSVTERPATVDAHALGSAALADYERRVRAFPAPRPAFLSAWLAQPESVARAVVDDAGEVLGYGVVRPCSTGAKIAPLFADDADVATALLDDLLAAGAAWGEVSIDVPDPNEAGLALVRQRGMRPEFACVRMYRGADPDLDLDRVFGVTSFELG